MISLRLIGVGLVTTALVVIGASSFSGAQPAPSPGPSSVFPLPTPPSIIPSVPPTLAPANQPTSLPYPAYGSPAPGATSLVSQQGVPQIVTLAQSIAISFAKSPTLAGARGSVDVANAPVLASTLAFLPAISGTGSSTHTNRQQGGGGNAAGATALIPGVTSNSLGASLRQLIFDGGNLWAQLKSAKASENAQVDAYRRTAQTLANTVAQSYYGALAAQRTTAAAVQSLRNAEAQVALVQAQISAGTAAASAVAQLQFQAAQARATLVTDQGNELVALAAFANALGLDPNVNVKPQDDIPVNSTAAISTIPIPSYEQAVAKALVLRPDYDQARKSLDAAKYTLKAAYLGYFPTLTGTASWGTASTDTIGQTFRNSDSVGLTLAVPVPFFDSGVNEGKILQAKGNIEIQRANVDSTKLSIEQNVKSALVTLISAKAKLDQVQFEYTSAVTALQAAQAQYKVGLALITDLINAQNQYTAALVDQVNAAYSLRQAEQSYLFSTGEIANVKGP